MKNNIKTILPTIVIAILLLALGYYCGQTKQNVIKQDTVFQTKTDTLWKDSIITKKEFVPKEIVKKKVDTLYLNNGDTMLLNTESKRYDELITSGVDTCFLTAFVSGVHPSLDSLSCRMKTHHEVVTNTVEVTKYLERKKTLKDRIRFAPNVSVGYGVVNKKPDIYVGFGLGIDLW